MQETVLKLKKETRERETLEAYNADLPNILAREKAFKELSEELKKRVAELERTNKYLEKENANLLVSLQMYGFLESFSI